MSIDLLRVVLDINVFVSALFYSKPESAPSKVYQAMLGEHFRLIHSPAYLDDLARVLGKDKFTDRLVKMNQTVNRLVYAVSVLGEDATPDYVPLDAVRDKDDLIILACAVGGKADYIVSGDKDLTDLVSYKGIPILTPDQFLTLLNDL